MKATASEAEERSARAAVVHWLKAYGLRAKVLVKSHTDKTWTVFGSPLSLHRIDEDHAAVPNFVVEACQYLQQHASTEGLFRKSGSFSRMKELKERIQCGEASVCAAPACDVAGLLKQFFRELPEPLIARELHDVFYRAQQLEEVARLHATLLLTCLLPPSNVQVLRYLMAFLKHIAHRSDENRMDVANLAVVFAPNLMHSGSGSKAEKVSSSTEKQLRLQAMVVQTLILHAKDIGKAAYVPVRKCAFVVTFSLWGMCRLAERANGGEGTPSTPSLLKRSRLRLTLSTGRRRKQPRLSDKKAPSRCAEYLSSLWRSDIAMQPTFAVCPRSLCSSEEVLGRPNIREVISGPMQGSVSDADLADVKQAQIDTTTPLCAARSAPALVTGKPPCFPDARRSGRLPSTGRDSPEMPELPDRTGDQANSQAFRAFCESAKILSMLIQDTPQVLSTSTFTPRCRDAGISSSVTVSCGNENTTAVHSPDCISSQTVFQAGELMTERAMESSSDVCGTLADGKSECVKVKEEGEGGEKCNGESEDNVHIAMSNMSYAEYKQVELRRAINESVDILGAKEDKEPQQPLRECGVHEDLGAAHSEQLSECHLHISESSTGVSTEAEISLAGGQDAASIECLEKSPLSELGSKLEGISLCYTGKKCRQAKRLLQSGTSVVVSLQSGQESGVITSVANVSSVADRIRKFNDLKGKEQFSRPRVTAAPLAVVPTAKRQHVKQIISILETNSRGESAKRDPVKVGLPAVQKPKTQNIVSPLGESLFKTTRHQLERSSTQAATKTARAHGATEKSQGSETFIPKSGAAHWLRSASKQGQLKTQSTNGSPCTPVGLALVNLTNQPSSTKSSGKRGRCRPHTEPAADTPKASPTLRPGRRGSVTRRASQREKRPSRGTPRRPVVPQRLLATHMAWDL
ncbi:unnamed protein product [Lampetra planeri]